MAALVSIALLVAAATARANDEAVILKHGNLTLNGRLVTADGKSVADGVVLLTHGTLAHNGMEIIATLQTGLQERGVNSLAINLSLGLDGRTGMYDCAVPHRHRHEDALDEIGAWLAWLKAQGAANVTLMGHSRGGNQTAWFAAERADAAVTGVVLLAPGTWSAAGMAQGYERANKTALKPIHDKAAALVAAGQGGEVLTNTGLLYCPGAEVSAASFVSYYKDEPRRHTPALLAKIGVPVLVIAGSNDRVVAGLPDAVAPLADGETIRLTVIDGADHFFRDLYAEDVADTVAAFVSPE